VDKKKRLSGDQPIAWPKSEEASHAVREYLADAQSRIKINIAKYSQIETQDGITGAQVARRLLDSQGLRRGC
jgi:hypothetical protein